jgi:hypothetical protein
MPMMPSIHSREVWMSSGTAKLPNFIPVHEIELPAPIMDNLMAYHAMTGCDTTSQFAGKGKKTSWKVFMQEPELLKGIGDSVECNKEAQSNAEQFVCHLYGHDDDTFINNVRLKMFVKGKSSIESLPPTQDALSFHIKRANYQAYIWKQALVADPQLPTADGQGWKLEEGKLKPVLVSLEAIPKACKELVSCSCKSGCQTNRCGCLKIGHKRCTSACYCKGLCQVDSDDD